MKRREGEDEEEKERMKRREREDEEEKERG